MVHGKNFFIFNIKVLYSHTPFKQYRPRIQGKNTNRNELILYKFAFITHALIDRSVCLTHLIKENKST